MLRRPVETRLSHRTEGRCPQAAHMKRKKRAETWLYTCWLQSNLPIFPSAWLFFARVVGSDLLCVCDGRGVKQVALRWLFSTWQWNVFIIRSSSDTPPFFIPALSFCSSPLVTPNSPTHCFCCCFVFFPPASSPSSSTGSGCLTDCKERKFAFQSITI